MRDVLSQYQHLTGPIRGTGQFPYRGLVTSHPGARRAAYRLYLKSAAWKATRTHALQRAGYRCASCGQPRTRRAELDVHHVTYERLGHERPEDLLVLCRSCHKAEHEGRR